MKLFKAPVNVDTKKLILVDQKLYFPHLNALHLPLYFWFGWEEKGGCKVQVNVKIH